MVNDRTVPTINHSPREHDTPVNTTRKKNASAGDPAEGAPRRGFFRGVLAAAIGAFVVIVPGGASLITLLDPLFPHRRAQAAGFVPVAPLDAVPADGRPRRFQVIADRTDAWNKYVNEPLGAVYLTRTAENPDKVVAFNALCPHLGCFVSYQASRDGFYCPCHRSVFQTDGAVVKPSPAERGLDELETKVESATVADGEESTGPLVLVNFQNFRAGGTQKIPK